MDRHGTKISKACEPCRRRKIRCNGEQPCGLCQQQPSQCSYRTKARVRPTARQRAALLNGNDLHRDGTRSVSIPLTPETLPPGPAGQTPRSHHEPADPEVYRGITATHTQGHDPESDECAQLFYGPSSNFAFLQQLHKSILDSGLTRRPATQDDHGETLDSFVQRSIFFGTPSKANTMGHAHPPAHPIEHISAAQASTFMAEFKALSLHLIPLFSEAELDQMLFALYPDPHQGQKGLRPQEMAIALAILACGALATSEVDLAETLYGQAKLVASALDEAVTLSMIQFYILLADYQLNMGRPNAAYLHLGNATRRALAMGLNRETSRATADGRLLQKRRSTMWCLYFHERWHALAMGRSSALKIGDISCQFPLDQPILTSLCEIARIAEANAEQMYLRKSESLQQLYVAAERTHAQLRRFAEQAGIGSSDVNIQTKRDMPLLTLHNVYYHAVLLTFRPFLITEALAGGQQKQGAMWLREACRNATDAAQDALVFTENQQNIDVQCKKSRFQAFFIESSCAVLLYDSLWHPTKHAYNLEYIHTGLRCLSNMVDGDPILNAHTSITRMIGAVEQAIASRSSNTASTLSSTTPNNRDNALIQPSSEPGPNFAVNDLIHFSDRQSQVPATFSTNANAAAGFGDTDPVFADPMSLLDFDVLTTDLYNFFPIETDRRWGDPGAAGMPGVQ